jgi:hypothetical protein
MSHISRRKNQSTLLPFVHEEYDEIPSRFSLAEGRINVFASPMALLDKSKPRLASKDFSDFFWLDTMFIPYFNENIFEPNEVSNLQR